MGKTGIQWATKTNPFWRGCNPVSKGCDNCYAERHIQGRFGRDFSIITKAKDHDFYGALKWHKPERIFVNSMADFFHQDGFKWLVEAWEVIRQCPHHTWLILTKRPGRVLKSLPDWWTSEVKNVWIGVTIEDQEAWTRRKRFLRKWEGVISNRFVSFEPLLSNIEINDFPFEWGIIGGESGFDPDVSRYTYRPCEIKWIEELIRVHKQNNIPVFVKQMGTHLQKTLDLTGMHGSVVEEWPRNLQIREFPKGVVIHKNELI